MIPRPEADRIRRQLEALLAEDAVNSRRLGRRLAAIASEKGVAPHAALLLILTRFSFGEQEAKRHWDAIVAHQEKLREALGRDVALRVAALDHFLNWNRREVRPAAIDLTLRLEDDGAEAADALTGLAADRVFRAALQAEIRRARRYRQRVAVALFDLDGFAAVNSAVGELVGDRLLRDTAILLHNKIRDIDLAARTGEDELALLLPETDRNGALLVAERFRREVESHFAHRDAGGRPVALTVSGGVVCYPEDANTGEGLLERAAQALYQAKASGKNNVGTYHPEFRRFLRISLEADKFEVEVLAPRELEAGRTRSLGRTGIVFGSPEPLHVGEELEIRLVQGRGSDSARSPRIRGRVVRLEEVPVPDSGSTPDAEEAPHDRFEVGLAFDSGSGPEAQELLEFFEQVTPPTGSAA